MFDVAVIGAGVVGASIARELSKYNLSTVVLEKGVEVCQATTKANSDPGTLPTTLAAFP